MKTNPRQGDWRKKRVTVATIYELDMIISLYFRHIVRKKTIDIAGLINVREEYRKFEIYSPMEVVESEY